tara:strand:- start:583 stop:771 length:189 start_codon:yes stop_codon:yes gene_type:complete
MGTKRKILLRNVVKVNFGIPTSLYGEFEELYVIVKRQRKGKLLKKNFIIEIIKMGIRQWFNK